MNEATKHSGERPDDNAIFRTFVAGVTQGRVGP